MGRKKKNATDQPPPETKSSVDYGEIVIQHAKLKGRVAELSASGDYFKKCISLEMRDCLLDHFDAKIQEMIANLENIDRKDLEKSQGHIAGLREAKQILLGTAWDSELQKAEKDLAEFEEANALFLDKTDNAPDEFNLPDGATAIIIRTRPLDSDSEDDNNILTDLDVAGFLFDSDESDSEADVFRCDNITDDAIAFANKLYSHPAVAEIRTV